MTTLDNAQGLSNAEAARRLLANGPNQLLSKPEMSAWRRFALQFNDPLVYLLLAALAISLLVWAVEGRTGWPVDALVIAAVVLLNAVLGWVEQGKARQAVAELARMSAATSSVLRGGVVQRIPSAGLVCGDVLLLAEGDAVGADAQLIQADALRVQEASLTGESAPVGKTAAARPATTASSAAPAPTPEPTATSTPLGDRIHEVFMGTSVAQGSASARVTATGMHSQMGQIAGLLDATPEEPTHLEKELAHMGRQLGVAVVIMATIVVGTILWLSDTRSASEVLAVLLLGVALAVAAVPEGMPAILSVVLALGVRRMAGHRAIVKKLSSVETLGAATVICTDKTGTLTRAEMTIVQCITASGTAWVTGVGYAPEGKIHTGGDEPRHAPPTGSAWMQELQQLLLCGALAGNASLRQAADGVWCIEGDPTDAAFLVAQKKLQQADGKPAHAASPAQYSRIAYLPFTSERKLVSTVQAVSASASKDEQAGQAEQAEGGSQVIMSKGAPGVLLNACSSLQLGNAVEPLTDSHRAQILADVERLSSAALRTLAVAYRPLQAGENAENAENAHHTKPGETLEKQLIFVGIVGMLDPPRAEVAESIAQAQAAGIRIIMITGDHPRTAERIGLDIGIASATSATSATSDTSGNSPALTGTEIDAMDDAALQLAVARTSVYARVSPANKLRIVAALQAGGQVVAMTGDGVNDAPALKAADIGVAMGITGTEVAKQAAKVILVDDNFATLLQAVREGRMIFDNIRKFLRYLLSANMGEVLMVFLGVVGAGVLGLTEPGSELMVLPLLATQILWLNLITDSWPALALGVDPAIDDVMARPPLPVAARVMDLPMWTGMVEIGLLIALLSLLAVDMYLPGGLIEGAGSIETARTAGFTTLVFAHLFQAFNARSDTRSAFAQLLSNPWLLAALTLSMLLQIAAVHLPVMNLALSTAPLSWQQWAVCLGLGSGVLWYSEVRKLGRRMAAGRKAGQMSQPKPLEAPENRQKSP